MLYTYPETAIQKLASNLCEIDVDLLAFPLYIESFAECFLTLRLNGVTELRRKQGSHAMAIKDNLLSM